MMQNKIYTAFFSLLLIISFISTSGNLFAQEVEPSNLERDTLLSVAREYIQGIRFCALITIDSTGSAHVRAMDPFKPDKNMVVWLATNRYSRKVNEIRNNHKVVLYYTGNKGIGYVSITGNASIVDDSVKKADYWKNEWKNFYSEGRENYILIKVVPIKLEILNYKYGILGDKKTWETPFVEFKNEKAKD